MIKFHNPQSAIRNRLASTRYPWGPRPNRRRKFSNSQFQILNFPHHPGPLFWTAAALAASILAIIAASASEPNPQSTIPNPQWTNSAPLELRSSTGRPYPCALVAERTPGNVTLKYLDGRSLAQTKLSRPMLDRASQELVWGPDLIATNDRATWTATPAQLAAWNKASQKLRRK